MAWTDKQNEDAARMRKEVERLEEERRAERAREEQRRREEQERKR